MNKIHNLTYQFKITLYEISPLTWRRIQVPAKYTFWDLHVALNDVMGWLDYHLHAFHISKLHEKKSVTIGIPDDEMDKYPVLPGWKIPVSEYFIQPGQTASYEYDFGDGWQHEVLLEGILLREKGAKYPKCIGGERACPPEDCGGVTGYFRFLEIIKNPEHEEYEETVEWLKNHAINYYPYNPDEFNPQKIRFDNPKKRLQRIFSE